MSDFGDRLRTAMAAAGLDGKSLAERSGVDAGNISRLSNGDRKNPRLVTAHRLATTLGVEPIWLMYGTGTMKAEASSAPASTRKVRTDLDEPYPVLTEVLNHYEWPEGFTAADADVVAERARGEAASSGAGNRPHSIWKLRIAELVREVQGKASKRIAHVVTDDDELDAAPFPPVTPTKKKRA